MGAIETQGFRLDNSGRRIVVDPVTRIEGHMRCEVNVDQDNVIRNAVSTGTMWRGLEVILKGRDPRDAWAFVERICGVCTGTHALTSVRAVEDALGIRIPPNAHLLREIFDKTLQVHDHVVHFYHLHALDWVDVVAALQADPKKTGELQQIVSPSNPRASAGYFRDVQNRLKKFVESGQLGPFANGYWGSRAYVLPAEANLMAVTHYLEALDLQKDWVKVHTIIGGKNPHPNFLVGGMPCAINLDGNGAAGAPINMERLNFMKARIDEMNAFVNQVYLPDVLAIGTIYKHAGWLYGGGLAATNVMDYGEFAKVNYDKTTDRLPGGAIIGGNWNEVLPVDPRDPEQIQEFVTHSWYSYGDETKGLHPWDGVTEPDYTPEGPNFKGSRTRIEQLRTGQRPRPATPGAAGVRGGDDQQRRAQGAGPARDAVHAQADAAIHHRPHAGTVPGGPVLRRDDGRRLERARRQHQGRRHRHRQRREVGSRHLAQGGQGRRHRCGAARRAGALDQDQGRQDRQLPVRGADHLERQPARPQGADRCLRGQPAGHAHGRPRAAAGDPAHAALLRPLPGLLHARDEPRRPGAQPRQRALSHRHPTAPETRP
jgi:hypothetical protein